jgi:hypothetical protein
MAPLQPTASPRRRVIAAAAIGAAIMLGYAGRSYTHVYGLHPLPPSLQQGSQGLRAGVSGHPRAGAGAIRGSAEAAAHDDDVHPTAGSPQLDGADESPDPGPVTPADVTPADVTPVPADTAAAADVRGSNKGLAAPLPLPLSVSPPPAPAPLAAPPPGDAVAVADPAAAAPFEALIVFTMVRFDLLAGAYTRPLFSST